MAEPASGERDDATGPTMRLMRVLRVSRCVLVRRSTGITCGDDVVTPVAAHSAGIDRFSGTTYALAHQAALQHQQGLKS